VVSSVNEPGIAAGQLLVDGSALGTAAGVDQGTLIVSQLSGSAGGTGTYEVSISQNLAGGTLQLIDLGNDYTGNVNQAPTIAAPNIALILGPTL
jgi:hypothetical protein